MSYYDLMNGGSSMLAQRKPAKPVKMQAPDATEFYLHDGENEGQYLSFLDVVADLAQAFKFLPKYDQMKYQYGEPLYLLGKDNDSVKAYIDSLLEFSDTSSVVPGDPAIAAAKAIFNDTTQDIPDAWDMKTLMAARDVYLNLDTYYSIDTRVRAGQYIQFCSENSPFGDYSKQSDPDSDTFIWGKRAGVGFTNLTFSPNASDWDLIGDDIDLNEGLYELSIFNEINGKFDWSAIKAMGSGLSYYQIAMNGISGIDGLIGNADDVYSDEQSFNLMCSMLEARERVFKAYSVFEGFSAWIADHMEVDPHNLGILRMFFGMQTDFINTVDAYINCQTYWGSEFTLGDSELGGFSNDLMSKVGDYIETLSGEKKKAAETLRSKWLTQSPRYDKVDGVWTGELTETEGSWVKNFCDQMDECGGREVVRVVTANLMNRTKNAEYKQKKERYDMDVQDDRDFNRSLERSQAKRGNESRIVVKKLMARNSQFRNMMVRASKKLSANRSSQGKKRIGTHRDALSSNRNLQPRHLQVARSQGNSFAAVVADAQKPRKKAANVNRPSVNANITTHASTNQQDNKSRKGHSENKNKVA